jgi:DNA-binding response OmpR family regulator
MKDDTFSQTVGPASAAFRCRIIPPHRILMVEDDSTIRQLGTRSLINFGYHVDSAEDGAAAWESLQLNGYDLLITDNNMPRVGGLKLIRQLRAARMSLPVIMATGDIPYGEFARYPWLQPAAVLLKPYTTWELLGTMKEVLREPSHAPQMLPPPPEWQRQPAAIGWRPG